jgi:hypothetical protein
MNGDWIDHRKRQDEKRHIPVRLSEAARNASFLF